MTAAATEQATMFDLSGRLALVTGARRGIGLAIAEALARAGADIIGASAQLEPSGSEVQRRVEAAGRAFTAARVDLGERAALERFVAGLLEAERPIDILVNNAGVIARAPAITHDNATWDRVIEIDLSAPFILARELGRGMVERRRGKVIFIASLLSYQGGILVPSYAAAKSGAVGLVRALSNEWAPHGVNVNAIVPGYISTDNTQALREDAERSRSILERIPAGRWGEASDIAGAALFLSSAASDYVCGAVIPVDGGWLAR